MLATDGIRVAVNTSSFDRQRHQHHHFDTFDNNNNQTMDYFIINPDDNISDCDAKSDKSISNNNAINLTSISTPTKTSIENTGRSSRRKQLAPRSRLVRQCDLCDFSSSITNEFKNHMKFEHGQEQVFLCDICRYYSLSSYDYHLHLNSHHDSSNKNNHQSSPSPLKLNLSLQQQRSNVESEGEIEDDDDEHRLNIDDSKEQNIHIFENDEQSSDDEQNPSTGLNKKLNLSVTSSHSHTTQQTPSIVSGRKRPYNVSVDPARYRRVPDPDDANSVKFACSLCGNLYKWRKSLNKHWKEKHNDENPPPLDAPVTIRPSKSSQSKSLNLIQTEMLPTPIKSTLPINSSNITHHHPAFPFNPYTWFKLATSMQTNSSNDQSINTPLDLRIKSTINNYEYNNNHNNSDEDDNDHDDDERESSDDTSSSSPQNSYGQKIFICSICDQRFLSVETVNEHFLKNHLNELENEIAGKSPPRNTNVAQQNEEWNLSDPVNPLKCIQCDFVGRWPTELQKHAASHSTSRPFKCLVCSLTYKWRWDLAKHWDRAHACGGKGVNLINPYKKRDRDQARSMMDLPTSLTTKTKTNLNTDRQSICSSTSNENNLIKTNHNNNSDDDEQSQNSILSDNDDEQHDIKRLKQDNDKILLAPPPPPLALSAPTLPPSMYFPSPFFPHHPMFSSFINPSLLLQPKFNYSPRLPHMSMNPNLELLKQASAFVQQSSSPNSSRSSSSSSPRPSSPLQHQQRMHAVAAMVAAANGNSNHHLRQQQQQRRIEKEERNFQCRWCDYRGRWRSELIQHMRCHHARDKPYHCSACPYASSWKWDVQKHVKKQHAHDTAKIVELPDKYLFQTTLKAKYEGTDDRTLAPAPLTDEDYAYFGSDVQEKLSSMKYTRDRTLSCQQCPFAANSMAELRRHLIVHSAESPYHCFNCNYKSKWKCDVKKHMKICNHHGPVLVGRKAMAKVMESLGLVIGNNKTNSLEKTIEQKQIDDEEEDEIIVDENQQDDDDDEKEKIISTNSRTQNNNLRCRKCDYEAEDLSDLLIHRKGHALIKNRIDFDRKHNSDIENDDNEQINIQNQSEQVKHNEQIFVYELQWLENNPLIKQFITIHEKTRIILYQCSKCNFKINNNHQHFLNHIDHQHPEILEDRI